MRQAITICFNILAIIISLSPSLSFGQAGLVQSNGITIAYESFGPDKKETILLISGANTQLTMWSTKFCKKLAKQGFRVIRFDNRDIGLSTKFEKAGNPDWLAISKALQEKQMPPLPYSLDDMADDAVGLLKALHIQKAHIVGASMGGMIAQRIAYNHPEFTLSLTSIMAGGGKAIFPLIAKPEIVAKIPELVNMSDTTAYIEREFQSEIILAGGPMSLSESEILKTIKSNVNRSYYPIGGVRQGAASLAGFYAGRQDKLKTIKVPTVVIHGDQDPLVVLEAGKDVATNVPNSIFEVIKGMGHNISEPFFDILIGAIVRNANKSKLENKKVIFQKGYYKVSIFYSNEQNSIFDMHYYTSKHMTMVANLLGKNLISFEVNSGVSGRTADDKAPFVAIGHFYVKDISEYRATISKHRDTIISDFKNYTNIQPIIQISRISNVVDKNKN